ncbi:MAG: hypothetical protein AAF532_03620 [Planctomycetota bacterium]
MPETACGRPRHDVAARGFKETDRVEKKLVDAWIGDCDVRRRLVLAARAVAGGATYVDATAIAPCDSRHLRRRIDAFERTIERAWDAIDAGLSVAEAVASIRGARQARRRRVDRRRVRAA